MTRNLTPLKSLALTAALAGCVALAGCSMTNPQETQSIAAAVPGVQASVGPLEANNLAIVSAGDAGAGTPSPDAPGRVTGSLYNSSSSPVTATLSTQSSNSIDVTVPPNGQVLLGDDRQVADLTSSGAIPGGMTTMKIQTDSSNQEVLVPVLDGTLAQYRQYVPTPSPSASTAKATASASPGPATPTPSSASATH